ncbi:MAG TPA: hypothetical protein DEP23_00430 [Ruminococcaceae bacterium]|nr:hypothetical protein [Oscillospiraceae bacterium]
MSIYRFTVRFNLENEQERRAAEYLISINRSDKKSRNRFVIETINAYFAELENEKQDNELLEKIRQMFREEVQVVPVAYSLAPVSAKAELTETEKVKNAKSVLDDLEMFE